MLSDFKAFLLKANVVGLSLAVIVGGAAGALVTAMTNDFIMPIVGAVTPDGDWRKWTLDVGNMKFGKGSGRSDPNIAGFIYSHPFRQGSSVGIKKKFSLILGGSYPRFNATNVIYRSGASVRQEINLTYRIKRSGRGAFQFERSCLDSTSSRGGNG